MPTILLPILPGTLPPSSCFATEQERLVAFAANLQAQLDGQAFYNFGDTKPTPANQGYPWLRTQDMRWYLFSGQWITPNPETSAFIRRLFVGTTVDLQTYDGGDAGVPSDRSGPMWEVDTAFEGRSPMGPGTLPLSGTVVTVANNFGADEHSLSVTELPTPIPLVGLMNDWGSGPTTPAPFRILADDAYVDGTINVSTNFDIVGGGQGHNSLGPVRGCYVIKRVLTRLFYAVP